MRLSLQDNLPFVTVTLVQSGRRLEISNILIDTGSGGTIFAADDAALIGIAPQDEDVLRHVHGVGGSEVVFMRRVEQLQVGEYVHSNFEIEVGGMDYGFDIHGILGMDFLLAAGAHIEEKLTIEFKS
jgi:predicted aspartyl protease